MTPEITALRLALCDNGYTPLPLYGKSPPVYGTNNKVKGFAGWQNLRNVTRSQVEMWGRLWEDAENTGILTRETPAFDLDIYNEEAAIAAEEFIRERFEERGYFLPRIGLPPKRAIPFRTLDTFDKIWVNFEPTHDGKPQKIEFLCNGQQLAVDGIHPDTGKPYSWPLGQPWKTKRDELPYISAEEAQQLVDDVVELLVRDFGYVRAAERPKRAKGGNGQILNEQLENERDWQILIDNILKGHAWHDSLRDIIAKYAASGMGGGAITNSVRALMETTIAPKDQRWQDRFDDIPRLVESALDKYAPKEDESEEEEPPIITPPPQQPPPPPPGAGPQQGPQQGPQPQRGPQPGPRSRPGAKPSSRPKAPHEGEGLQLMTFAPIKYVVPSVIVEGLSILAGKPKLGKSWLMLHAAIAVARGGFTLGSIHCIEGDVLYCSLEDNERRLQSRMTKLLGVVPKWPKRFQYFTLSDDFPRLNNGGLDWLKEWIDSVPEPRLIVIDTFTTVRAVKRGNQPNYDADYESGKELQKLANERGIAIVIVYHLRKADADDAYDTVNATLGLTGVVDSVLILKNEASGGVTLFGRGRDLLEIEKGMEFNKNACTWNIVGDAATIRLTKERETILNALEEAGIPIGPREIAIATGMKEGNVRRLLRKMHKEGIIKQPSYGRYTK